MTGPISATRLCDGCGQPGQPYTYRGRRFDGLHADRGRRLCSGCLGDAHRALLADWDAAVPVAIGGQVISAPKRRKIPYTPTGVREVDPSEHHPRLRTVTVHTKPVPGCQACADPVALAAWLVRQHEAADRLTRQARDVRREAELADRAALAAEGWRDNMRAQAERRRLHGRANCLGWDAQRIRDRAEDVDYAHRAPFGPQPPQPPQPPEPAGATGRVRAGGVRPADPVRPAGGGVMARHKRRVRRNPHWAVARHFGQCPDCGKLTYSTRRAAKTAARAAHPGTPMRVYQCGDYWHYGNTPGWVKRGIEPGRPRLPAPSRQQ